MESELKEAALLRGGVVSTPCARTQLLASDTRVCKRFDFVRCGCLWASLAPHRPLFPIARPYAILYLVCRLLGPTAPHETDAQRQSSHTLGTL